MAPPILGSSHMVLPECQAVLRQCLLEGLLIVHMQLWETEQETAGPSLVPLPVKVWRCKPCQSVLTNNHCLPRLMRNRKHVGSFPASSSAAMKAKPMKAAKIHGVQGPNPKSPIAQPSQSEQES